VKKGGEVARDAQARTIGYAALAMIAFAANSVLCRIALRGATVDPATFSVVRLISGAVMLLIIYAQKNRSIALDRSFASAGLLVLYAVPFSFAYVSLSTGTGALILFGFVQITMVLLALRSRERVHWTQWIGLIVALVGLVYLLSPTIATPSMKSAVLMSTAGIAWGVYSWRGRGASNPLRATTSNFIWAVPLVVVISLAASTGIHVDPKGIALAVASGALASGLGYVIWYAAVPGLSGVEAAVAQLSVPVLAAGGGVLFLSEVVSLRLALSTILVLGGIALSLLGPQLASSAAREAH
jgi:drug/metabolite transporter (DMT)-like permease